MKAGESNIRAPMRASAGHLGLKSGIGLVVSNMVGAGVFISAGFMAQDLTPGQILVSWVLGAIIALSGARAYATVASWIPRSGGEYRYLSDLMHPALGCLAGWGSLLVGFSAPIAVDARAAGEFARTLGSPIPPTVFGTLVIVGLGLIHALGKKASKHGHNLLFVGNGLLLGGFVITGLFFGTNAWPTWVPGGAPAGGAFPTEAFARGLFFIAFAFSGWNAATYAAAEFRDPKRDVPRALLIGCGVVALLYLAVNWVFVANLKPDDFKIVFGYDESKVTLGHVILSRLLGPAGGFIMSLLVLVAFVSAASAMTIVGPRVYATMAADGYLPAFLRVEEGRVPVRSIVLQCAVALVILWTHTLQQALANVGAILTLFAALVSASIFRRALSKDMDLEKPGALSLLAAGVHVASSAFMLYFGFRDSTRLLIWVVAVLAAGLTFWAIARPRGDRKEAAGT
jgi:APA family basic amino acid/polyamine antiporter